MKANRRYTQMDRLEVRGTEILTNKCGHVRINFTVDARHILLAITCLTEEELQNPSRAIIEERLKRELWYKGESWYTSPFDYDEDGQHYNLKENLEKAVPIAKKFFPEFMDVPNSMKFIKEA